MRGFWGGAGAVILFVTVTVIVVGECVIRGGCNEVAVVVRGARSRTTRVRGASAGAACVVAVVVRGVHGRKVGGPNTITAASGGVLSVTAHVIVIVGVHAASYHCRTGVWGVLQPVSSSGVAGNCVDKWSRHCQQRSYRAGAGRRNGQRKHSVCVSNSERRRPGLLAVAGRHGLTDPRAPYATTPNTIRRRTPEDDANEQAEIRRLVAEHAQTRAKSPTPHYEPGSAHRRDPEFWE
ncbi:hypothetical protein EDB83DRAFT_2317386 [Lactarius deliciosus]|nr:hypothetical protein EDB83DRAFT_2317386 [Lactarius deliciosus]